MGAALLLSIEVETGGVLEVGVHDEPYRRGDPSSEQDISLMWNAERDKYHRAADVVYSVEGKTLDVELADSKRLIAEDPRFAGLLPAACG